MKQLVKATHHGRGILSLSLNRPEKRNALNIPLLQQLIEVVEKAEKEQRVVIFKGEGPVFCSGMDLTENVDEAIGYISRVLRKIYQSPMITIAAVHGAALAGGAGLMSACDYVVASEEARFGYPEVRRGVVAAQVSALLWRQLRLRDAQELLLFGEMIDAEKALRVGLINEIVGRDALEDAALRVAATALKGGPKAIAVTKEILRKFESKPFDEDLDEALSTFRRIHASDELKEGIAAFKEKRAPRWAGE